MSLFNLEGKTAVVTGGSGVLGGAMARGLADAGATVGILGRTEETVDLIVDGINSNGANAIPLVADVLNQDHLSSAANKIMQQAGSVDILVNAAGGNMPGATIMPHQDLFALGLEDFDRVTDLNLKGTVMPTTVFGALMKEQGKGCIVNISSMAAMQTITRVVGYSAAKAAVENYTKWMAVEFALRHGDQFRVNAIAPGFFLAEQNKRLLLNHDGSYTDRASKIIAGTPMGRLGNPEELIGTLLWLCSDAASFVTGIVVPVDGGFSAFSGV